MHYKRLLHFKAILTQRYLLHPYIVLSWSGISFTAELDGTYEFCLRLKLIRQGFRPSTRTQFSLTTSTMCRTNVVGLIYTTRSVVKSRHMVVAHDSRKQTSHRLNQPLEVSAEYEFLAHPIKYWFSCRTEFANKRDLQLAKTVHTEVK